MIVRCRGLRSDGLQTMMVLALLSVEYKASYDETTECRARDCYVLLLILAFSTLLTNCPQTFDATDHENLQGFPKMLMSATLVRARSPAPAAARTYTRELAIEYGA